MRAIYTSIVVSSLAVLSVPVHAKSAARPPRGGAKVSTAPVIPGRPKRWEVRTAPIALLASWSTLDVSYRLSDQIATGPAVVAFGCKGPGNMLAPCWDGYALGWQGIYYFRGVRGNSPYVSGHAYYDEFKSHAHAVVDSHDEVRGVRAHAFVGDMFHAPVNVIWQAGAGVETRNYQRTKVSDDAFDTSAAKRTTEVLTSPMLEAKIGLQF
jgi:hypothetical protein